MKDSLKKPDYSTPARKKRFVESECRRLAQAALNINEELVSYLDGSYGNRRQKAILAFLDRAEKEFASFGLSSVVEAFTQNELLPVNNYNHLDGDYDIRIGAALWILKKLREAGRMADAYEFLPDVSEDPDLWYLPIDFSHPCFSNDLIQSVIYVITNRYPRDRQGCIITEETARGKPPEEAYRKLVGLIPEKDVNAACGEFRNKVWELAARYLKGKGFYDKALDETARKIQNMQSAPFAAANPHAGSSIMNDPISGQRAGITGFSGNFAADSPLALAKLGEELLEKQHRYPLDFDNYLQMDRRTIRKEAGREIAEALADFTVSDPYELCFALFWLIDNGDDTPWLVRSGSSLMHFVICMLPWYIAQDDWTDEEFDAWFEGMQYNRDGWMEQGPIPDQIDFYHQKHDGRNLAQIIYELCRCVVPTGLHPFEKERVKLVEEGMDEAVARKLTDTAELMFLQQFQARKYSKNWFLGFEEQETDWKESSEAGENAESGDKSEEWKEPAVPERLRGYWGKVAGLNADEDSLMDEGNLSDQESLLDKKNSSDKDILSDKVPLLDTNTGVLSGEAASLEIEKLRAELEAAKKQIKSLRSTLAVTRQEAGSERAKYEHELKGLKLEHRELADLRELVFHSELSEDERERRERPEKQYSYPYNTRKRTVIFGGHDSFLRAIKPLLPDVRFVDASNMTYSPEIIRNAEVVWIQNNCISHPQYYSIVKNCKLAGVQMRYFTFAGAEKCAEQLVTEDQK